MVRILSSKILMFKLVAFVSILLFLVLPSCGGKVQQPLLVPKAESVSTAQDSLALQIPLDDTASWHSLIGNTKELDEKVRYLSLYLEALLEDASKRTSLPPTTASGYVSDLTYLVNLSGDFTFTWSYINLGDYNQDGVVSIGDVLPLARHFFHTSEARGGTPTDAEDIVIDGNLDGVINIADVKPLADNFFRTVHGYVLEQSVDDKNSWTELGRFTKAELSQAGTGRITMALVYDTPIDNSWYRVRPYQDGNDTLGIPSNEVQYIRGANGIILRLITPAESGNGTEESPYVINVSSPYELRVETIQGSDVSALAEISATPPFLKTIAEEVPRTLTVDDPFAGEFYIQATLSGETNFESNVLWFTVQGGLPS